MAKFFGTDGIRAKANTPPMDSDTALLLGRAAAQVFRHSSTKRHRIFIAKDTRVSGYMLETALCSGISSMGVDVLLAGPLPTPAVAFMTRSMRADAGVMISASHNSYEDNGIKFFGPDGFKLPNAMEEEIEHLMEPGSLDRLRASPEFIGKAYRIDDAVGRYAVFVKSCLDKNFKLDGVRVALDCANGAAYKVSPLVFSELGAVVSSSADRPDGKNINENCGSTHPEQISSFVRDCGSQFGVSFDGDADRVLLCDENGELLDGDDILAILALEGKKNGSLKGGSVVGTVMSNLGLELFLKEQGLLLHRAGVGDRYVLSKMRELGVNIGGEQSGHIISLDHNTTGDGLLSALLVLSVAVGEGKPLSYYRKLFPRFPQILKNVAVKEKIPFEELPVVQKVLRSIEDELLGKGRVLLRYSGTELMARVMVECDSEELCLQMTDRMIEAIDSSLA